MRDDEENGRLKGVTPPPEEDLWEETAVMPAEELFKIKEKMMAGMGVAVVVEGDKPDRKDPIEPRVHERITDQPRVDSGQVETIDDADLILLDSVEPPPADPPPQTQAQTKSFSPFVQFITKHNVSLGIGLGVGALAGAIIIFILWFPFPEEKKTIVVGAKEEIPKAPVIEKEVESEKEEVESEDLGTIQENYRLARKFYQEGDRGRRGDGTKLNRSQRINSLLNAQPYFERLVELHKRENTDDSDVWFMKARAEYSLAKYGHDREENAKLAIESYKKFKNLVLKPTKNQKKTMVRNMKALRAWVD